MDGHRRGGTKIVSRGSWMLVADDSSMVSEKKGEERASERRGKQRGK